MRVAETVEVGRPVEDVLALLREPERSPSGEGWRDVRRDGDGYRATLESRAGPIRVDFDCRFSVAETAPAERVRVEGLGVSPRLGFTFAAEFAVRASDGGSRVEVEAEVCPSGTLAGLGQRELGHQARRLLVSFLAR